MLGTLDPTRKKVTVIGAGISGLLAAYRLDQAGYEVCVFEAAERAGGLISTHRDEFGISESAAHSLLATEEVRKFFSELGVSLSEVRANSRARYIFRNGKLRKMPLSFKEAITAFFRAYFVLSAPSKDATLSEWGERHLGKAAVAHLLTPFVHGIYGAEPGELSVDAAFPALRIPRGHSMVSFLLHKILSGKKQTKSKMTAPTEGMGSLVSALEAHLRSRLGERFHLGVKLDRLPEDGNVVITVPAHRASGLLQSASPELSRALDQVTYTPLIAVTAFVDVSQIANPPRGVGALFSDQRDALGILFNSSSFPNRVRDESKIASFTLIFGGSARSEQLKLSDAEIRERVAHELKQVLGLPAPVHTVIRRQERGVPRYDSSLSEIWRLARETWCSNLGHVLFGNYTGQVSLRGMIESSAGLATPLHKQSEWRKSAK